MTTRFVESANGISNAAKYANNNGTQVFNRVMRDGKNTMALWLRGIFNGLSKDDAADIVQESSVDLWLWCNKNGRTNLGEKDVFRLWMTFCRFKHSHWMSKASKMTPLSDVVINTTADDSYNESLMEKRAILYDCLDSIGDKERTLMTMTMDGKDTDEICSALGFKNKDVLKNFKCRTLKKMKREMSLRMAA